MPAEHAVLGLLALDGEDPANQAAGRHGYDLARRFVEGEPLGEVLRLEPGMLYHHLKKLARAGWVEAAGDEPEAERRGAGPPRRRYRLTAAGAAELRRWLGAPVSHTREIRLEFLVKLYFARRLDPGRAERLIAEQQAVVARSADSLAVQLAAADQDATAPAGDRAFRRLVLGLRLAQTRAAAAWLDQLAAETPPTADAP